MADLMRKIADIAQQNGANTKVTGVTVRLGALAHISADHFREHFVQAARGSAAEGATLDITESNDMTDPHAQDIMLETVEVEA
jgi:hydrogenase nickel incorporation protein HypA/HybF